MNIIGGRKDKNKEGKEVKVQTWKEKKKVADAAVMRKDIKNLNTWVGMMQEAMNNQQLKEYIMNRLDGLEIKPCQKSKTKVQTNGKAKSSGCSGIMALVWKFHKD